MGVVNDNRSKFETIHVKGIEEDLHFSLVGPASCDTTTVTIPLRSSTFNNLNEEGQTLLENCADLNDLGEKRAHLGKFKMIEKDIGSYETTVDKLESKL